MEKEIAYRIQQIRRGEVPEGYRKGPLGIVPDEWSEVPFSTLFTSRSEYTDDLSAYPLYSLTIEEGITPKTERYERSHLVKKENSYKIIRPGEYAYNPMNLRFGAVARHKGNQPVAVSGYYDIFATLNKDDQLFMDNLLNCDAMLTYYNKVSTGSLIEKQRVHFSEFMKFSFPLPPLNERIKIAGILAVQDKDIELQQKKIDEMKKLKKVYLERMFPKHGSNVPEIRFPEFTDPWEQRKLGELVQFSKGSGYSKADLRDTGTPIILYGRLYTKYETVIKDVDTFADKKPGAIYSHGGEVIVPASGETAEDISIAAVVEKSGVLLGGDLNIITSPPDLDPVFLAISISNGKPHKDMAKMAQGKSVVHLHNTDLEKINLLYPSYAEQIRISNYFRSLDTFITLHQRELDEMKKLKKTLIRLLMTGIVRVRS